MESSAPVAVSPAGFGRHYQLPSATRWFLRCLVAAGALIGIPVLLNNQSGLSTPVVATLYYAAFAAVLVWGERALPKCGLYESAEAVTAVKMGGSVSFRWELIERFEHSKTRPRSRVLVVEKNGRIVPVVGTAQGARIVWSGGETRDIVGVLNERLASWRSCPRSTAHDDPRDDEAGLTREHQR